MLKKLVVLVLVLLINHIGIAHQLPQKLNPNLVNNTVASEHMNFTEQEITHWSQYAETLDITTIAEKANIPIIISYNAFSLSKANPEVECSIYLDLNSDKLPPFCGDLDDHSLAFMLSGLAAIGFCHFKQVKNWANSGTNSPQKQLVPFFTGPSTFMSSMNETTHGAHHDDYKINQGLQFYCVEVNPSDIGGGTIDDENS